jgi:hypothetical protein
MWKKSLISLHGNDLTNIVNFIQISEQNHDSGVYL